MSGPIGVVVVDDHPLYREGVAKTLDSDPDITVIAQGADADDALRLAREHLPDVILLDVSMPGDGVRAAQDIAVACPVVKAVMLTVSEDEDVVHKALEAGARGYVLKGVSGPELVTIIRQVYAGDAYITPSLAASLLSASNVRDRRSAEHRSSLEDLTPREREILEELAKGASNKVIADRLSLSEKTVKHHMTNILQKLQVRNRVEAALIAQRAQQATLIHR